jgi:hypothetical protein
LLLLLLLQLQLLQVLQVLLLLLLLVMGRCKGMVSRHNGDALLRAHAVRQVRNRQQHTACSAQAACHERRARKRRGRAKAAATR